MSAQGIIRIELRPRVERKACGEPRYLATGASP